MRPRPAALRDGLVGDQDDAHVNLGLLRLGDDELVLYDKQSDGSVLVTYLHDVSGGVEVGVGSDGTIDVKGISLSTSTSARAALLAAIGGGETWRFPDVYAADAGMAALSERRQPSRGQRIEVVDSRDGIRAELSAGGGVGPLSGGVSIDAGLVSSVAHDPRDGSRTYVLEGSVAAGGVLQVSRASAVGQGVGDERIALTTASDGRPLELTITRTGRLEGADSLPDALQGVADRLVGGHHAGRSWVVDSRLDLTDPESLRVARAYLDALPLPDGARAGALRRRIDEAGVTETRTYALATRSNGRLGAHTGRGIVYGFSIGETVEDLTLLDAQVRGPDGLWRSRDDCLVAR